MPYTTIDKSSDHFQTETWSSQDTSIDTINFAPDWVWIKSRTNADTQVIFDTVRGANKRLSSSGNTGESTTSDELTAFNSDGYTLGTGSNVNRSGHDYVSWNWLAGGTAPAITYSVKVVSDSGNKYRFDDFGTSAVTLDLQEGGTYTFDQSDSSNSGHPLRFSTTSDGSHGGGSEYTTGVTTTGTPGSAGAKTVITVGSGVATLYYYCTQHSGMGGQANTNSTHGSSNFSGSIQANVSANTTAGFSIVSYTGTGSNATVGHGLGAEAKMIIFKDRDTAAEWRVYHVGSGNTGALDFNTSDAIQTNSVFFQDTTPTSSVFSLGTGTDVNNNTKNFIAYCFADTGNKFFKAGSYSGNGSSTNGTFVYTGFKPAFVMGKYINGTGDWYLWDNKRLGYNRDNNKIKPNTSDAETTEDWFDMYSNGFKFYNNSGDFNYGGYNFIYMAIAESPFVTSTGIPTTAR